MTDPTWPERLRALYSGNRVLWPSQHNQLADHIDALEAEIARLRRIEAAVRAMEAADDPFDESIARNALHAALNEEATR